MATAVHRLTLEVRRSINPPEPEYQTGDWIIDPDIPDAPKRHWVVIGDDIQLKSAVERDIADTQYLESYKQAKIDALEEEFNSAVDSRYPGYRPLFLTAELQEARDAGLNNRAAYIQQVLPWIKTGMKNLLFMSQDEVRAAATIEDVDSVTQDLSTWLGSDPMVSIRTSGGIMD